MGVLTLQRELLSITVSMSLFLFAHALVGIFIPLIMLQEGLAVWQVALFYAVYSVAKLLLNYPAILIAKRFGPHIGLGMGFTFGASQFAFLGLFTQHPTMWLIYGAAIALALTNAAIWNSQHVHVSRAMDNASKSSSLATMEIINQVIGVVAPLLGAGIAAWFGSGWLLTAGVLIILTALLPLKNVRSLSDPNIEPSPPVKYSLKYAPKRDIAANFCFNIETSVGLMLWPVFLAVEVASFHSIGVITAIAAVATVIVVAIAGHRGDRGNDRRVLLEGVAVSSALDFARILPLPTLGLTVISAGYRASLAYMNNAWTSSYYHHAKRVGIAYVLSMEIACDLAYLTLWLTLLGVSLVVSAHTTFVVAFVLAGIAAWGCLLISRQGTFEADNLVP